MGGQIQSEIMQLILDRGLRPGQVLPTETELMDDLGVSRNSVREALKALQALDIVEIRHGYGTYVGQASLTPLADGLTFRTLVQLGGDPIDAAQALGEILQVREVLEEGLVLRIVDSVPDSDLDELDSIVGRMEARAKQGEVFPEEDRDFHEVLYRSLGNTLVPQLLGAFWNVFHRVAGARGWADDPSPMGTARRHREIVRALRARDRERVRAAMSTHFRGIESRARKAMRGVG
ncbi:FadR/GntR family transcriptional regulator [Streptomyces sp. NPDC051940]|uniref:FadR/GntR family transcriptional regulator n=1 Tax=Streptomyces sp. NPDC051940 TaxID=3155675 RepID=UPI0034392116